eukprot:757344-Hanusia_phi.AAC.1
MVRNWLGSEGERKRADGGWKVSRRRGKEAIRRGQGRGREDEDVDEERRSHTIPASPGSIARSTYRLLNARCDEPPSQLYPAPSICPL